jgi:DNA-cytosine methyltransferase
VNETQTIPMLDLFSGIGGFALAAEIANAMADAGCEQRWQRSDTGESRCETGSHRFTSIAHAEVEPFACAVYHRHFPDSVCFGGVQNVTRDAMLERCGRLPVVVTGGFPCQPHSCAGKRLASADDRDLWGECGRVLGDLRPRYALFENVAGLLTSESGRFFNRVLSDLAALRYACVWQVVPASAVGAPHRRERVWIICRDELADSNEPRPQGRHGQELRERGRQRAIGASDSPLLWPALDGHWPSRPGEAQHGWEYPRVIPSPKSSLGGVASWFSEWMDRSAK